MWLHHLHIPLPLSLRAYARMGGVYVKQDKLSEAVKAYDHSLAEHRNQEVVKKKIEVSIFEAVTYGYYCAMTLLNVDNFTYVLIYES